MYIGNSVNFRLAVHSCSLSRVLWEDWFTWKNIENTTLHINRSICLEIATQPSLQKTESLIEQTAGFVSHTHLVTAEKIPLILALCLLIYESVYSTSVLEGFILPKTNSPTRLLISYNNHYNNNQLALFLGWNQLSWAKCRWACSYPTKQSCATTGVILYAL